MCLTSVYLLSRYKAFLQVLYLGFLEDEAGRSLTSLLGTDCVRPMITFAMVTTSCRSSQTLEPTGGPALNSDPGSFLDVQRMILELYAQV